MFGEPNSMHSYDYLWMYSNLWYTWMKDCCYATTTFFCGICIALYWGWIFGEIACQQIWCFTPLLRMISIQIGFLQKCIGFTFNCCCAPFFSACGLIFSSIYVTESNYWFTGAIWLNWRSIETLYCNKQINPCNSLQLYSFNSPKPDLFLCPFE